MHGVVFKVVPVTAVLLAALFISSLTFAGQRNMYASAGCMACHQGEQITDNSIAEKDHKKSTQQKRAHHSPQSINSSQAHAT